MECLGSFCGCIAPIVVNCSTKHINYLSQLEENINQLAEKVSELSALKNDVKNSVDAQVGRMMTDQVKEWMQIVDAREPEVHQILSEGRQHLDRRCLNGCCPKNCWSSYKLGKQVAKKLLDVEKLLGRGVFPVLAIDPPPSRVQKLQEYFTVGLESVFERALNLLAKDDIKILGLHGAGGVGKTTLLKKINNEFQNRESDFDIVIWVVISREVNIRDVQKAILERLGLKQWSDSASSRADAIFNGLDKKKFLILLDDVWEKIDLQNIGIPLPSAQNKSKIVLTTRNLDVCGTMEAHDTVTVNSLNKEQSWILFKEKVGQNTLTADPEIPKLAEKVAEKCGGLPLALITVASTMASKTNPREWKHAFSDLNKCVAMFAGVEPVLHVLKFSYDKLPSSTEQVCFLFCALYPEDNSIYIRHLIEQWIGKGYIGGFEDFEDALNIGHSIIGTLKRTCLLEDGLHHSFVKMHDVVRELALWIARECGREEGKVCVKSGDTITELPMAAICPEVVQTIALINTKITHFSKLPNYCPNLTTFFTPRNYDLNHIIDDFFLSMPALKFLDLSNTGITKLPTSVCELFELEFLDLFNTKITSLPYEMSNLVRLKYLSLAETMIAIPCGIIMNFSNLEILKLRVPQFGDSDEEMHVDIDELRCLNKLKSLGIQLSDFKDLEKFFSNPRLCNCAKGFIIESCKEIIFLTLTTSSSSSHVCLGFFKRLEYLAIRECAEIKEWIFDDITMETEIGLFECLESMELTNLPKLIISLDARNFPCAHFRILHSLRLEGCDAMVDLTWLLLIPKLQILRILKCDSLQEILSSSPDKSGGAYDQKTTFSNLAELKLKDLPNLQSICSTVALPFPSLKAIFVSGCPKLKRLPLDSNSAINTLKHIDGEGDWWNGLQWENETIRSRSASLLALIIGSVYIYLFYQC